eukprot:132520-Rhodomonas_salina.1
MAALGAPRLRGGLTDVRGSDRDRTERYASERERESESEREGARAREKERVCMRPCPARAYVRARESERV